MPGDIHSYLNQMLGAARSKSGDELLVYTVEQVLAGVGPKQAEVLRKAAVPRWVDRMNVLFLLDLSDSVSFAARERAYRFVAEAVRHSHMAPADKNAALQRLTGTSQEP